MTMSEGPPETTEKKEEEPISEQECLAAMRERHFERVGQWYAQQEVIADKDPSPNGRVLLTVHLARLQFESGVIDEDTGESYAVATLEAAREDCFQRSNDEGVRLIDDALERMRPQAQA